MTPLPIELDLTLDDWQAEDGSVPPNPIQAKLKIQNNRIDLEFHDGRSVWIEQQDGKIRIHGYLSEETGHHEPMNLDIEDTQFVVSTDAPGDLQFERVIKIESKNDG
ncbi:hypothetical protein [Phaeobacter piscinae]|uniref:hypothetical protein n=1 Tax=Phaeobacter piscinae TaxID=1580596 RepID=UPI00058BBF0F|nr:hypothetical protein [Phaeobacter piscinae]UTS82734.1 hypothetical protein OL67_003844 [Phaeobacter piscinae]